MFKAPKLARQWGIGSVAGIAMLGGLVSFASPASADVSGTTVAISGTATSIAQGAVGAAAANWTFVIPSSAAAGDQLDFIVNPKGLVASTLNCAGGNYISIATTPTIGVSGSAGLLGGAAPTVSIAAPVTETGTPSQCATIGVKNEVVVTVTKAATSGLLGAGGPFTATISGVEYTVGPNATLGAVSTADSVSIDATTGPPAPAALTVPSNATVIMGVSVAANNPPTALTYNLDSNVPISPIVIGEGAAGQVPTGYVCVKLLSGNFDLTSTTPTVTVESAVGTTGLAVVTGAATNPATNTLAFDVTKVSTTPTAFAISNIMVDGGNELGPVGLTVTDGSTATCTGGNTVNTSGVHAFSVLYSFRTAGLTADATAADEMEAAFPYPTSCPASKSVVLATDANYPDALSASYLAGVLDTGILLTPTAALSTYTATALAAEGITTVYVVGGPLAVSPNVISTLQASPAYTCGATAALSPVQDLKVVVISGATQYDTSQAIATYFQSVPADVGQLHFAGAYGRYDNTTGAESTTGPTTNVPTAILATGNGFQDASAASVLGYADKIPVVLTDPSGLSSQAQASLTDLGIQQVILVGGPLAVSDTVVEQVEDLGISLIRIAGQDYTDTAQELARFELSSTSSSAGPEGLSWDTNSDHAIVLAHGDFYADALAGAPYAAQVLGAGHPVPILLTFDPNTVGTYLTGFLNAGGSSAGAAGDGAPSGIDTVLVVGGIEAITPTTLNTVLDDIAAG